MLDRLTIDAPGYNLRALSEEFNRVEIPRNPRIIKSSAPAWGSLALVQASPVSEKALKATLAEEAKG